MGSHFTKYHHCFPDNFFNIFSWDMGQTVFPLSREKVVTIFPLNSGLGGVERSIQQVSTNDSLCSNVFLGIKHYD